MLLIIIKSSFMLKRLLSHTIPLILKYLSIKALDDFIFKRKTANLNKYTIIFPKWTRWISVLY